jgi:hypothetical protein
MCECVTAGAGDTETNEKGKKSKEKMIFEIYVLWEKNSLLEGA